MTRAVSAEQMRAIEGACFASGGTAVELMGRAGRALSSAVKEKFPDGCRVAVLCGKGNNGGDGYAAASFLSESGFCCSVWSVPLSAALSAESSRYRELCEAQGLVCGDFPDLDGVDCIIDCLAGIGFQGRARAELASIIDTINASSAWTLSADVPSGLPSDGPVDADAPIVRADCTVSFGCVKRNLMLYPGRAFSGRVIAADIGFSAEQVGEYGGSCFLVDDASVRPLRIAPPAWDAHKYRSGHCVVAGGFAGMEGAALMAADAALETGTGLVTIVTEESSRPIVAGKLLECMTTGVSRSAKDDLRRLLAGEFDRKKVSCLLLGPGLGRGEFQSDVYDAAIDAACGRIKTIILDGDALWFLSRNGPFDAKGSSLVLTPHAGEAANLLGVSSSQIQNDPYSHAVLLSGKYGCTALLKGPSSVVAGASRQFIPMSGNRALASGGSGDVLAGICAALCARGIEPDRAAALAAFVHGRAADLVAAERPLHILRATELIGNLRRAFDGVFQPLDI